MSLSQRAVPRRARQNKTPSRTERYVVGSNQGDSVIQPIFPSLSESKIYDFIQHYPPLVYASSTTSAVFQAASFSLSGLDQAATFSSLFDTYRIKIIEVTFVPRRPYPAGVGQDSGTFYSIVDTDDAVALSSLGAAREYATTLQGPGFMTQRRTFIPHSASAAYGGTGFTQYSEASTSAWYDVGSPNVQYYGIKTAWTITTAIESMDVYIKVHLQFKRVR